MRSSTALSLCSMKNKSGPHSGTLLEGEIITGGHLHHPGGHYDEEGVVHPRGWGYVLVAMCFIPLSHVLNLAQSSCTASFVNIFGSYGVLPSLPSLMNWIFSFELLLCQIESFGCESTWCMSCDGISVVTIGCSIDLLDVCFGYQLAESRGDIGVTRA